MTSPADALRRFELAGEHDEAGREAEAIPLYREALDLGLIDPERSRAVVQLASSLRNVGKLDEALALLTPVDDVGSGPDPALDPALAASVAAFRALVLHDLGRHSDALSVALAALAPTLPAYRISVAAYAEALTATGATTPDAPGFANVGTLEALPGQRDALVGILTRRNEALSAAGCLAYEVGIDESAPDTVFVSELWERAAAHRASLELPAVRSAIAEAMPLLTGVMGGFRFTIEGSPLRTTEPVASGLRSA